VARVEACACMGTSLANVDLIYDFHMDREWRWCWIHVEETWNF